jgi:hypothetical protein
MGMIATLYMGGLMAAIQSFLERVRTPRWAGGAEDRIGLMVIPVEVKNHNKRLKPHHSKAYGSALRGFLRTGV